MVEPLEINVEKPVDVSLNDVKKLFMTEFKIPATNFEKDFGVMFRVWFDKLHEGCYASIKIPIMESGEGFRLNVRYQFKDGKDKWIYAPPATDESYVSGVIPHKAYWANSMAKHAKIGLDKCHSYEKYINSSVGKAAIAKKEAERKETTKKLPKIELTITKIVDGALSSTGKCYETEFDGSPLNEERKKRFPCKKLRGEKDGMLFFFNITPRLVTNYNDIREDLTYAVPALKCGEEKKSAIGNIYKTCEIVSKDPVSIDEI